MAAVRAMLKFELLPAVYLRRQLAVMRLVALERAKLLRFAWFLVRLEKKRAHGFVGVLELLLKLFELEAKLSVLRLKLLVAFLDVVDVCSQMRMLLEQLVHDVGPVH